MENKDKTSGNIDLIIEELKFGKYQIIALCIAVTAMLLDGMGGYLYIFTTIDVEYRCKISECENSAAKYAASWVKEAIPLNSESEPQKCQRFAVKNTWNSSATNNCSLLQFNNSYIIGCDESVYGKGESLVKEFDLACQNWKPPLAGTMYGIGMLVGLTYAGLLSDKFGRKYYMVFSLFIRGVLGVIQALSPDYWTYVILEFIIISLTAGSFSATYILCVELLSTKHRVLGTMLISLGTPVSSIIQGFTAMWIPYWRTFLCVIYVPTLLFIIFLPIVDESIRWLVVRRRYSDAISLIEKVARYNNIYFTENAFEYIENIRLGIITQGIEENVKKVPFIAIFRSRCLMLRLLVCALCWITNILIYVGLNINSVIISTDHKYLNFILVNIIEIVSIVAYFFTTNRLGRKICLTGSLVLCGIVCGAYAVTPVDMNVLGLVFYLASKFFISFSFTVIYLYTSEFFPTTLRHTCLGFCAMVGGIGNILAPQTALMSEWHKSLPMSFFALAAIFSGICAFILPETFNTKLPETIVEAENIGQQKKPEP